MQDPYKHNKICSKCLRLKSDTEFHENGVKYKYSICKNCRNKDKYGTQCPTCKLFKPLRNGQCIACRRKQNLRICNICKVDKPSDQFYFKEYRCKECIDSGKHKLTKFDKLEIMQECNTCHKIKPGNKFHQIYGKNKLSKRCVYCSDRKVIETRRAKKTKSRQAFCTECKFYHKTVCLNGICYKCNYKLGIKECKMCHKVDLKAYFKGLTCLDCASLCKASKATSHPDQSETHTPHAEPSDHSQEAKTN